MYDTLDSLLLNNSPKSMEMVSQVLSSKLEQLVAQDSSDVAADETAVPDSSGSKAATETEPEGVVTEGEKEKAEPTAQG
jgi:hypothetical protein